MKYLAKQIANNIAIVGAKNLEEKIETTLLFLKLALKINDKTDDELNEIETAIDILNVLKND